MAEIDVRSIETMTQALRLCADASGKSDKELADALDIEYGHFSRMLRETDSRNFPPEKLDLFMRECGNVIPLEWLAMKMSFYLHEESMHEILVSMRDALLKQGGELKFSISACGTVREVG